MFGRILVTALVLGLLGLPSARGAAESHDAAYWRGWCAGRTAGLQQASTYVHAVKEEVLEDLKPDPEKAPVVAAIERLFLVVPFVSFGPPLDQPFTVELADGRMIACPSGELSVTRPRPEKG